ncbi:MAG: hypothetical protein HC813_01285 [Planctomycetes bacterium]|nr:hypothetical protein [Planctomycetota bacterium]
MAEVDRPDAMTQIHVDAIYGHQGEQFLITKLDYDDRRAYAKRINPDYFTEAESTWMCASSTPTRCNGVRGSNCTGARWG